VSSLSRLTPWCLASHLLPHRCRPQQRTFIGGYHYRTSSTAQVATVRGQTKFGFWPSIWPLCSSKKLLLSYLALQPGRRSTSSDRTTALAKRIKSWHRNEAGAQG
jgi:hypothetical protein